MTTLVAVEIKIQFVCKKLWYNQENMSSKSLRLAKGKNEFFPPKIHATNYNQNFLLRFGKKTTLKLYILRRLNTSMPSPTNLAQLIIVLLRGWDRFSKPTWTIITRGLKITENKVHIL
mgnify:CR=1 FL=1